MYNQEETTELIKKAQNGNEESKTKLLVENSPLIKSIVRRYRGRGIEYEDLYQLGCMGFLKAVKNFSFEFEVRFSTYAVPMIMGEIKRYLRDDGYIKISRTIKSDAVKINAYVEKFRQEKQSSPTVDDIAKEFEMNPHDVAFVMDSTKVPLSIYDNCDDDNSRQIIDKIPSEENENKNIDKILLRELIKKLPEREKKLIILRYFRGATQCEVARQLGVSQVQVSRIENKVINMLKEEFLK